MALRAALGSLDYTVLQKKGCDWNHARAGKAASPVALPSSPRSFPGTGWGRLSIGASLVVLD